MVKKLTLRTALLTGLTALIGCASPTLTGTWRSHEKFTSGDYAAVNDLECLYAFHQGGTMTESSNYDSLPPCPPAYGIWRHTGGRTFESNSTFYISKPPAKTDELVQGWPPNGRADVHEVITLSPDGKSFDSALTYKVFTLDGKELPAAAGAGHGHAMRLEFAKP